ncbi:MAG: GNAT family N-acetyltransferase [Acidobacteria bacterium]|nr:GNAT family N-acetyltransferase [Acidobacteriota bacterium]
MTETTITPSIRLRSSVPEDEDFLVAVYGSTRQQELAMVPWTEEQKEAFVRFQLKAQLAHYQNEYPNAEYSIILFDDQPVGRLYIDRREDDLRIMDITLLPEHRGKGISSPIIRHLMDEASVLEKRLSINLDKLSQSQPIFEHFGFNPAEDSGFHVLYAWHPQHA